MQGESILNLLTCRRVIWFMHQTDHPPYFCPLRLALPTTLRGRSQFALLHFGQTRGFSGSRGNHSCPHRQRQPSSCTMPISFVSLIG